MSKSSGNFISLSNAIQGNNVHLNVPIVERKHKEEYVDAKGKTKSRKIVTKEKHWEEAQWRSQSWTADTVRFALAEAGDTMNDANFQTDIANNSSFFLFFFSNFFNFTIKFFVLLQYWWFSVCTDMY